MFKNYREYFRGVVWPRNSKQRKDKQYTYAIVGILVTDKELDLSNDNEVCFNGPSDIAFSLESMQKYKSNRPLGTANDVLIGLGDVFVDNLELIKDEESQYNACCEKKL